MDLVNDEDLVTVASGCDIDVLKNNVADVLNASVRCGVKFYNIDRPAFGDLQAA